MTIGKRIRREQRIHLHQMFEDKHSITDKDGVTLVDCKEDYFIYFKAVNFKPNGIIEGTYLGENPTTIIDDKCKMISYTDDGWKINGSKKITKTARLVAVENKTGVIVIIENN